MCLALGIDDPIGWLESAPPRVVRFWEAFFRIEPFGCDWERSALQASMTSALTATVAASAGAKNPKVWQVSDFMPQNWTGRTTKSDGIQSFKAYAKRYTKHGDDA